MITFIIGALCGFFYARNMELVNSYFTNLYNYLLEVLHLKKKEVAQQATTAAKKTTAKKKTSAKKGS